MIKRYIKYLWEPRLKEIFIVPCACNYEEGKQGAILDTPAPADKARPQTGGPGETYIHLSLRVQSSSSRDNPSPMPCTNPLLTKTAIE